MAVETESPVRIRLRLKNIQHLLKFNLEKKKSWVVRLKLIEVLLSLSQRTVKPVYIAPVYHASEEESFYISVCVLHAL